MENFGENIRKFRINNKYSQTDFARMLGIKQGSLADIERGKVKSLSPSIERVLKRKFGLTRELIFNSDKHDLNVINIYPLISESDFTKKGFNISDGENKICLPFNSKFDFCFFARGDSMFDKNNDRSISDNDLLCCKVIKKIRVGEIYLLNTEDGVFVRKIAELNDIFLLCTPLNKTYKPHSVNITDVFSIAHVSAVVSWKFF